MQKETLPVIFLAFANDKQTAGGYLRNLTRERNALRDILIKPSSGDQPICEIIFEGDVSVERIFDTFQDERYRDRIAVFHYGGHAESFGLLLESSEGRKTEASAEGLVPFLSSQNSLQLVFLNGCSTQWQAEQLRDAGIPAVVGTSRAIPDDLATSVAQRFYSGLAQGLSIERAWRDAILQIRTQGSERTRGDLVEWGSKATEFPWHIFYRLSARKIREWNLPEAAGDPLFGLPEIDEQYYLRLPGEPFPGLRRFERKDAGIFFGRSVEIRALCDKLDNIYPIILYHGQSGVGKSSLLEAGLIPRLESTHQLIIVRRMQNLGLTGTLHKALTDLLEDTGSDDSLSTMWRRIAQNSNRPLIIILDQVEESFTRSELGADEEWEYFTNELASLAKYLSQSGSGKLLLSFRTEYYTQIQDYLDHAAVAHTDVFLGPLKKAGIREAILGVTLNPKTAERYHLTIASEELSQEITNDLLKDPNAPVAPTLQILMEKMWQNAIPSADRERTFDLTLYEQVREQGLGLVDYLGEQFAILRDLNSDESSKFYSQGVEESGFALDLLMGFVTPRGTANAHTVGEVSAWYPQRQEIMGAVVEHFVDARILSSFVEQQKEMRALSHDTLAPIVREQFEVSDRPGQRARRILEGKMHGGQAEGILDEVDLAQVEQGKQGMRVWGEEEQELVKVSRAARDKRMKQRKRRMVIAIASAAAILLFGIAATFFWRSAKINAEIALINGLAAKAQLVFNFDQSLGLNLAIEAFNRLPNQETASSVSAITEKAGRFYSQVFIGHDHNIRSVAFSPDGLHVLSGSEDSTAALWTLDGLMKQKFIGHKDRVSSVAFSPDGRYVLTGSYDKTAKLWSLDGQEVQSFVGHKEEVMSVTFSPDSKYILTGGRDSTARLWTWDGITERIFTISDDYLVVSVAFSHDSKYILTSDYRSATLWNLEGENVQTYSGHKGYLLSVCFSPDDQYVLTCSADNMAKLWTLDGKLVRSLEGHVSQVRSGAFSPDGQYILTAGDDGTAKLWSVKGQEVESFAGHANIVRSAVFSHDGNYMLTGSEDRTMKLWPLDSGLELQTLQGHKSVVYSVAFSPDGQYVLTGSMDHSAKLWTLDGREVQTFSGHKSDVSSVTFSPDNRFVLTGSYDGTAKLWTLNGVEVQTLDGHSDRINAVAFSPDALYILTGSDDSTAILWTSRGTEAQTLRGHDDFISSVAYSPDGQYLLTGSWDRTARLWNTNGEEVLIFPHERQIITVAFSPDGQYILTGSIDNLATLWTIDGIKIRTFAGHDGWVRSVAFSHDMKYILTGSSDQTARLWTFDGLPVQTFMDGEHYVNSAAISSDGQYIVTASSSGKAKTWLRWDYIQDSGMLAQLTEAQKEEYGIEK